MPMLMHKDKKNAIRGIISRMSDGTESGGSGYKKEKEEEGPATDASTAKSGAMQKFLSAVESKDTKSMAGALETFFTLCQDDSESETEEYS